MKPNDFTFATKEWFSRIARTGFGPLGLALAWAGLGLPAQGGDVLVPAHAVWRFLDNGSDQGTAWRAAGFSDAAWRSGAAELGYGDNDEATVVGFGASDT